MDAEVAVIGIGTMGSMALWQLAKAGARAIGFEQFGTAHDRSAVGGESRLFRMAYHESPEYVPVLRVARQMWDELEMWSGASLFTRTGCLSIGDPDHPAMRNVRASIDDHDLPHEYWDADQVADRFPQHRLLRGEVGLLDLQGGVLRPELAVLAATDQAVRLGARVITDTTVDRVEPEGDHVVVRAGGRDYRVGQAVISTGAWTGRWLPGLEQHVTAKRIVLTWFAPRRPADFAPSDFPVFIRDSDGVHLFGVPMMDGASVKVGFADRFGTIEDPDEFVRDIRPERLTELREAVARFLPGLHPNPIRVSVHMDGYTPDRHALVGAVPGARGLWVLGGFSGHGFKMAPVFGRIAAELVIEGKSSLPITRFDPGRLSASAATE
jgi:sarcosine oxidase